MSEELQAIADVSLTALISYFKDADIKLQFTLMVSDDEYCAMSSNMNKQDVADFFIAWIQEEKIEGLTVEEVRLQ